MVGYKEIYSGKIYEIHFKWSDTLNVLYVTLMYGLGMPILFPIAAFSMINNWVAERITLAYIVR